jgi:hypothetical protein
MEKTKGQLLGEERIDSMLDPNGSFTQYGLTKREYFVGLAMQSMVARSDRRDGWSEGESEQCLYIVDTLLEALSKP